MKKKNLLLTLAMVPTMLLGIASVTSCGSTTRYNADNAITRRAALPGSNVNLSDFGKYTSFVRDNSEYSFNLSDVVEEGDADPANKQISVLFGTLKEMNKNCISDNGILLLKLSFTDSFGTINYPTSSYPGGSIQMIEIESTSTQQADTIQGCHTYLLGLSIYTFSSDLKLILNTGLSSWNFSSLAHCSVTPVRAENLTYTAFDSEDTSVVTYEQIGKAYTLAEIFEVAGSETLNIVTSKINAPVSKNGKKIIQFTIKNNYTLFELSTNSTAAGCVLTDAKEQPSNSAYVTKIVEFPSTLVNLLFDIEDALPSGDASENFFLDLDNDLAIVKSLMRSDYEYDSIIKDGGTKTIVLDVDSRYTEEQIISQVKAVDLFGVDVPVTKVSSDYVIGKTGTFNIVISATDTYGQTAQATLICDVRDYAVPVITQKVSDIHYDYGTLLTEAKLLENFELSDNMGVEGLTTKFVYPSGFDINKALVFGKYALTLEVSDAFGNKATKAFTLNVVDNVAPVISKKSGQIGDKIKIAYSTIGKNTINTILNYYNANDAIDGACEIYLKDGKIPSEMAGDFTLKIAAKDKSDNEAVYTVNCEIVADLPPVFILSDKLVNATVSNPLDLTDLQNIVQKAILRKSVRNLQVNAAGYLATPDKEGSYPVSYTYYDDNNEAQSGAFTLEVTDDTKPVETKSNWFVDAFKAVFKDTKNASATQWVVVIGTFVLSLGLVGIIAYTIKKCREDKRRSSSRRRNRRRW